MIGSLAEFIPLESDSILQEEGQLMPSSDPLPHLTKRRGKSAFESYTPDDKTNLLIRYEKNNIYQINRKKFNSIAKEAHTKQTVRKPVVQHHSFFVKPEITKDYIAKEEYPFTYSDLRGNIIC